MQKFIAPLISALLLFTVSGAQPLTDSAVIRDIYSEALANGKAYQWLHELCKNASPRLSGSKGAADAVVLAEKFMLQAGATVFKQEVMVPHWVRGNKEKAIIIPSKSRNMVPVEVCALGGSIGTSGEIKGNIVEVKNFDTLKILGTENLKGKIVFYNRPMDVTKINVFEAYGGAVDQRWAGAMRAAPYGAIGVVVRSMTTEIDNYPHTGSMGYNDTITKIPACAISTSGAEQLSTMLKTDPQLSFSLIMNCETLPEEKSYNVIGEIKGSEFPNEIIVVGGHLDAWDLSEGAHDDGAGIVQSIEVINLFKKLEIKPKRTIRCVAFMNEENGLRGGKKYAEIAKEKNENHIAAIETDAGGFTPRGFFMEGDSLKEQKVRSWKNLFIPYNLHAWDREGGGADIGPLKEQGTLLLGLSPDSQRYFDVHHTGRDVFEMVSRRELELGAASMAALIYMIDKYGLD